MYALVEPYQPIIPSESFNKTIFDEQFRELAKELSQKTEEGGMILNYFKRTLGNFVQNNKTDLILYCLLLYSFLILVVENPDINTLNEKFNSMTSSELQNNKSSTDMCNLLKN